MKKTVLMYGIVCGLLVALLDLVQYHALVVEHSVEIYAGLVAVLFSALGIWLGLTLTRRREAITPPAPSDPTAPAPFVADQDRARRLGITPREMEILGAIAEGLSTREIAGRLCVSENTVKTHSSRLYAKLNAKRRTQAVQIAKESGLIA